MWCKILPDIKNKTYLQYSRQTTNINIFLAANSTFILQFFHSAMHSGHGTIK